MVHTHGSMKKGESGGRQTETETDRDRDRQTETDRQTRTLTPIETHTEQS